MDRKDVMGRLGQLSAMPLDVQGGNQADSRLAELAAFFDQQQQKGGSAESRLAELAAVFDQQQQGSSASRLAELAAFFDQQQQKGGGVNRLENIASLLRNR